MRISLDRQSEVPLYLQIKKNLRQAILSGGLPADTRLPSSRQLARDLGVNRITVDTAYAELEAEGLVYSRMGSGTYVLPLLEPIKTHTTSSHPVWPAWQQELAKNNPARTGNSALNRIRSTEKRQWIDFSVGVGDERLFPEDEFRKVLQRVMRQDGVDAMTYGDVCGYAPLRQTISQIFASQGLLISPDQILITSGSQQALALVSQVLLQPGDTVFVESPTYGYALVLFQSHHVRIMSVPVDDGGMRVDELEKMLQQATPKLIYTIPNFHNPTGSCLNSHRRRQLITLADRHNVPIMEDDFVGDLRYDGQAQPALKSLDPGGRVIYVSTFSKMLMPGLRVGFLSAEGPVFDSLVESKRVHDLATSNLFQHALHSYITVGRYQAHLRVSCQVYRKRRDTILLAIRRYLPADVQFTPPAGGFFLWMKLPEGCVAENLLEASARQGVLFAPGNEFFVSPQEGASYVRLGFASLTPEEIEEGMRRLGKVMFLTKHPNPL